MYGNAPPLSALSEAWEAVTTAKKELTNVDTKIRASGVPQAHIDGSKNVSFANPSQRSKNNPNIERRVVIDKSAPQRDMYRKENVPPPAVPKPKLYPDVFYKEDDVFRGRHEDVPVRYVKEYAPDFNYFATRRNEASDKGVFNSSLSGKVLLAKKNDSNALNRLKEKIHQQKLNASMLASTLSHESQFPVKETHLEVDSVAHSVAHIEAVPINEPMKRKVAHAPMAPTYKGFNQADGYAAKCNPDFEQKYVKESKVSKKEKPKENKRKVSKQRKSPPGRGVKGKGKMLRIVSPKKPMPSITTSSWRVGQEIRENLLKEQRNRMAAETQVKDNSPAASTARASSSSFPIPAETPSEKENNSSKKTNPKDDIAVSKEDEETIMDDVSMPSDGCVENSTKMTAQGLNDRAVSDVATADNVPSTQSEVDVKSSDPKDCKPLSDIAMSIMNELNSIPKEKTLPRSKSVGAVVDTGLKKKPVKSCVPAKRKSVEECYPKQKVRHYDQEEVQKYMQRQQAQRKQVRLKEKKEHEAKKEGQEQKLKELFSKQKEAVKESVEIGKRKVYGETFVKLSTKISSIMTNSSSYNGSQESDDVTTSQDVPTYQIPQHTSSPQRRRDDTVMDEICKDSLEVTGTTNIEKSMQASFQPISPYKPSGSAITNEHDAETEKPITTDVSSKASRVAAIHNTAAALRRRLDIEAKRISSLVQNRQAELKQKCHTDELNEPAMPTLPEPEGFSGPIPGTQNIDEQANFNLKLQKMEQAAKKIQSFYRGHCSRKNMHWKLPSGKTLFEAFEGARRSALLSGSTAVTPVRLASSGYPPITIPSEGNKQETSIKMAEPLQLDNSDLLINVRNRQRDGDAKVPAPDVEVLVAEDINSLSSDEGGSTASLISEAMTLQHDSGKVDSRMSNIHKFSSHSERNSFPSYSGGNALGLQDGLFGEKCESLRKVLEKHAKVPGDQYSVINIFTRNYPSLRRQQILEDLKVSSESELDTEKIIAEAYDDELKSSKVTGFDDDDLTEQSLEISLEESLDDTLVEQSIKDAAQSGGSHEDENDHVSSPKSSVTLSLADLPSKIRSKVLHSKDAEYSQDFVSKTKSSYTSEDVDSDVSLSSQPLSSCHSNAFSDIDTHDLRPVLSSTQRSMDPKEQSMEPLNTLHSQAPVDFNVLNGHDGASDQRREFKMSPNTLERKLKAEINHFESVGSSLQQVTEMERVRNVVDAQQEVVSLAQVLKSRQVSHRQELEKLSLAAKESAMVNAKDVETVKRAAAEATVDVMKTIAEVKAKAAEEIAASAVQLAQIQKETTSITLKALNEVEQARQHAATVYKQSVDQQLTNGEIRMKNKLASGESFKRTPQTLSHSEGYTDDFEREKTVTSDESSAGGSSEENSTLKQNNTTATTAGTSVVEAMDESNPSKDVSKKSANVSVIEESMNQTPYTELTAKSFDTSKTTKSSRSATILEELKSEGLTTPKEKEISEDVHEIEDDSQILFEQKTLSVNEDSFSGGNSEEKINSSHTEEELKHDFRMVLPSENHRRKSLDCIDNFLAPNDTSSDDLVVTPRSGTKWMKKLRSKSPFADENTFTKFTTNMVRQYIQEDEVRAKHQAALLGLREKALIEKTKAEMAYLEVQKKTLKSKGTDEKMPPITKKQRAVLMRLQAEQSEIRRLKEAHKAASYERRSMLYQQKEIQKIRESTQKIWSKLEHLNKSDDSPRTPRSGENGEKSRSLVRSSLMLTPDDKIRQKNEKSLSQYEMSQNSSIAPDEASQISEQFSESKTASIDESIANEEISKISKTDSSSPKTPTNQLEDSHEKDTPLKSMDSSRISVDQSESVTQTSKDKLANTLHDSKDDSSIADALKKLIYKSGEKYLVGREKKLESRKHQFAEIMMRETQLKEWRQKIVDEESKLKEDIHRALYRGKGDTTASSSKKVSKLSSKTSIHEDSSTSNSSAQSSEKEISVQSSEKEIKVGHIPSEHITSSLQEEYESAIDSKTSIDESIAEQLPGDASVSQLKSVRSEKSRSNIMEDEKSPTSHSGSPSASHRYSAETFNDETELSSPQKHVFEKSSKKDAEDSFTENTSDSSDIEQRLNALQDEIETRNLQLEKLRKKNQKELLRLKEQELKRQLNVVEQEILKENKDVSPVYIQNDKISVHGEELTPIVSPKRQRKSLSEKMEISDVEVRSDPSRSLKHSSRVLRESSKSVPKDESSSHSEVHVDRSQSYEKDDNLTNISYVTLEKSIRTGTIHSLIASDEENVTLEKSVRTGTIHSLIASDEEKSENTQLSLIHTLERESSDKSIKSERSQSKLEHKSSPRSRSKLISSVTDMVSENIKSSDVSSVSDQLITGSKSEALVSKDRSNVKVSTSDIGKLYGDDFEAESSRNGGREEQSELRSETKKSTLTEEDISELSNEILSDQSEHSSKSEVKIISTKSEAIRVKSSSSISEALSEKWGEEHISTAKSLSQSGNTTTHQSDLLVVSQKGSTLQSNFHENEPVAYDDSFVSITSKLSTVLPDESLKVDSTRAVSKSSHEDASLSEKSSVKISVKSDIGGEGRFTVNDRVVVEGIMQGVIKFIGTTPFSPVVVAGIHLDEALGTNDGSFQGGKYFDCDKNCGLFTTLDRLKHCTSFEEVHTSFEVHEEVHEEEKSVSVSEMSVQFSSRENSISSEKLIPKSPHLPSSHLISTKSGDGDLSVADVKDVSVKESIESFSKKKSEAQSGAYSEVDIRSNSSDVDVDLSLETEIPSPNKLDLNPMADGITDSILKTLLHEAIALPFTKTVTSGNELSEIQRKNELYQDIGGKPSSGDSTSEPVKEQPHDINTVTKNLINDALSHMMKIRSSKQRKLQDNNLYGSDLTRKSNLLSLIADDEMFERPSKSEEGKEDVLVDMEGRSMGLDDLKSVQDHLDALCGVDEDEETTSSMSQERVIPAPKSFRFEEPPLQIPWTIQETHSLVFSALNELTDDGITHANLSNVEPSDDYFSEMSNNKNSNEQHTKLYKQLIFESTKSILCEINEFHELQKQYRPEWRKAPRKTFTKFTRNSHMLDAASLCQSIASYISTCLDLKEGRPSLEKLKRRLPLNLNKKDYVDAVLVEEIREEEPLWVNYDEDELKVKFQLADDILNNLLDEIVDIIRM